jgi:hypothetical protein
VTVDASSSIIKSCAIFRINMYKIQLRLYLVVGNFSIGFVSTKISFRDWVLDTGPIVVVGLGDAGVCS